MDKIVLSYLFTDLKMSTRFAELEKIALPRGPSLRAVLVHLIDTFFNFHRSILELLDIKNECREIKTHIGPIE